MNAQVHDLPREEVKDIARSTGTCATCRWDVDGRCVLTADCHFEGSQEKIIANVVAAPTTGRLLLLEDPSFVPTTPTGVRQFKSGATRSADAGRYDPEGFLSPLVIERFCEYMNKHRLQPDGSIRGSDNWQKGIPLATYAKGMWRHFLHFWTRHRGHAVRDDMSAANIEEDLCAMLFNVQGYLFEVLKAKEAMAPISTAKEARNG